MYLIPQLERLCDILPALRILAAAKVDHDTVVIALPTNSGDKNPFHEGALIWEP